MTSSSQNNAPLDGLNAADLLKQGLLTDSHTGAFRHLFQAPPLSELAPVFPDLELIGLIGEGGMGAVYKARQTDLDRLVALKILPEEISGDDAFSAQFTREARALAKLNHPHIVTIYEFGKRRDLYYILMEYVDGTSLRKIMEKGLINPQEALAIIPQICDALQYAHDRGIVHRDIKPENILLNSEGVVKVADFGLAKLLPTQPAPHSPGASPAPSPRETFLSRDGKVMGTPAYMPPEQRTHPLQVDHRADIYSLGVVFYQMLTGSLPDTPLGSPPGKTDVDVQLDKIVRKAMADNPDHRYQQASIMKTAVETLSLPPNQSSPSSLSLTQKLIPRTLSAVFFAAAGTFILASFHFTTTIQILSCLLIAGTLLSFSLVALNYKNFLQTMKTNTPKRYVISLLLASGVALSSAGALEITQKEPEKKALVEIPTSRVPEKKEASPTIPLEFPAKTVVFSSSPDGIESWELEDDRTVRPTAKRVLSWLALVDGKDYKKSFEAVYPMPDAIDWEKSCRETPLVAFASKMSSLENWEKLLAHVQKQSGRPISRTWRDTSSIVFKNGQKALEFNFITSFEYKKNVLETVLMAPISDVEPSLPSGPWAVISYVLDQSKEEFQVAEKAQIWLELIDNHNYKEACDQMDTPDKSEWEKSFNDNTTQFAQTRASLGKVLNRQWQDLEPESTDSNDQITIGSVDDNLDIVAMHFHTSFENNEKVTESVSMKRAKDGTWKPTGYSLLLPPQNGSKLKERFPISIYKYQFPVISIAEAWLSLVDQQDYKKSYSEMVALPLAENAKPEDQVKSIPAGELSIYKPDSLEKWEKLLSNSRKHPFGKVVRRKFQSIQSFPGPLFNGQKRDYEALTFNSVCGDNIRAMEIVIMIKQANGTWSPTMYRITTSGNTSLKKN